MPIARLRSASWAATSGFFVLALYALGPALLVAAIAMPESGVGTFVYNAAFSVFPQVCAQAASRSACSRAGGLAAAWSWFLWFPVVVGFGYVMRRAPLPRRLLVGLATVIAVMALLQCIVHAAGWQQYVDAL